MRRLKKSFLFLCVLLTVINLSAQENDKKGSVRIYGKVVDSASNLPLESATVSVFKTGDKNPVNASTTNKEGSFIVNGLARGSFTIEVAFVGYQPYIIKSVQATQKDEVQLANILLVKKISALQDVVVRASAKLIENKIDRIVFNAEKDITSQTGVATDVLKKVPQVSVDIDGKVELAGSSSIRFLINGKPSTAFGSNITDVLQAIPANLVKSIEVITNPGAKYDAQGLGGIINIILKKGTAEGINGNLSLTAGTIMENGSFNLNARKGKLALNAFASGNGRLQTTTPVSYLRLSNNAALNTATSLQQAGANKFQRRGYQNGAGFDWSPNDKNSISGSVSYNNFHFDATGAINQLQTISNLSYPQNIISYISSINKNKNSFSEHNTDVGLNYKRTFTKEEQELEINVNSSFGHNNAPSASNQYLQPIDSLFFGNNSHNSGAETSTEAAIDYTQPLTKNIKLGVGSKFEFYEIKTGSDVLSLNPADGKFQLNTSLSNSLDYTQKVYALYAELSFPVGHLFDAKIGSRYERTGINAYYSNGGTTPSPGYNTLVPSVFFLRKLSEKQTLKLNYSQRIERPGYDELNPYVNTADPKNISAGNPYLKPETGGRIEISFNNNFGKKGSVMASLFYRESHNDIQPFIVFYPTLTVGDSVYKNVSVSTRQNIGTEKNFGTNLFGDVHLGSKLNLRMNVFLFYRHTINKIDSGYNSNSFNYRSNLNASYQFNTTLAAEFFGNFNSPRNEAQGRYPSFTSYSFAVRKQFWHKKGSLALTANNFMSQYIDQQTNLFGPGFTAVSSRKVPYRSVGLNFTWKFGGLIFKKDTENESGLPVEN
jgi:outer membrane receptor protein involved in Fe transport